MSKDYDKDDMKENAKKRKPNPFIDIKNPKANIAKFGKVESKKDAKKAALAKMMRKKESMK